MQAYSSSFARIYNLRWSGFARQVAPAILDFWARQPVGRTHRRVLDICCGTGQLAEGLLAAGYGVVGVDLSAAMLAHARQNTAAYAATGQASFVQADAARLGFRPVFGLALSTFDAFNHLPDLVALQQCFAGAWAAVIPGGWFIFDLNTRRGLQSWNGVTVDETDEWLCVIRGVYAEAADKAYSRLSGCLRLPTGGYERFAETVFNTAFELGAVQAALAAAGWQEAYWAVLPDLSRPVEDPEGQGRVFGVAHR